MKPPAVEIMSIVVLQMMTMMIRSIFTLLMLLATHLVLPLHQTFLDMTYIHRDRLSSSDLLESRGSFASVYVSTMDTRYR